MTTYERGDVILVDIAFSGAPGRKRRPAVVVSSAEFNTAGIKLIVAAMTSNVSPPFRPGDTLLDDWRHAGLLRPSAMRGVLATVDKADVVRKLGHLADGDRVNVDQGLVSILGLSAFAPGLGLRGPDAAGDEKPDGNTGSALSKVGRDGRTGDTAPDGAALSPESLNPKESP